MDSKVELYEYCKKSIPDFTDFTDIQSQIFEQHDFWSTTRNVFITAPTAASKSLIAYAAMAKTRNRKMIKSLYIVPFRALASQKYSEILAFFKLIDKNEIDYQYAAKNNIGALNLIDARDCSNAEILEEIKKNL